MFGLSVVTPKLGLVSQSSNQSLRIGAYIVNFREGAAERNPSEEGMRELDCFGEEGSNYVSLLVTRTRFDNRLRYC